MNNQPWQVAINSAYERLTDHLMASTAITMEAIFSGYAGPKFSMNGQTPETIFEWWQAMQHHDPDVIIIAFPNEDDAQKFTSISGGQMMG